MTFGVVLPEKNWCYDFDDGRILWEGGAHINVTPQEAAIFGLLDKAYPHKVNNKKFIDALYPNFLPECDLPDNPTGNIHVQACKLRRKLRAAHAPFDLPYGDSFGLWLEVKKVEAPLRVNGASLVGPSLLDGDLDIDCG